MPVSPLLGIIKMFGGNFPPRGWAFCEGQLLNISQNTALFSILGTIYGGDGRTTFGLPNLKDRAPMHAGNGPGLSPRSLGQKGGAATATLALTEIPSHTHSLSGRGAFADTNQDVPAANLSYGAVPGSAQGFNPNIYGSAANTVNMNEATADNTGGGQSHNNKQPFLPINFIIALQGVFPSRN